MKKSFALIVLFFLLLRVDAQQFYKLSGTLTDQEGNPISGAQINFRFGEQRAESRSDGTFVVKLEEGYYEFFIQKEGYFTLEQKIVIQNDLNLIISMQKDEQILEEISIEMTAKDPAYEIMRKAINARDRNSLFYKNLKYETYIKSFDMPFGKEWNEDSSFLDIDTSMMSQMAYAEVINTIYLGQNKDQIKEFREGVKIRGKKSKLLGLDALELNFSIYSPLFKNSVISSSTFMSPLNKSSFLGYKFKLIQTRIENGKTHYIIEMKPKKLANALYEGIIEIVDETWAVTKLNIFIDKGYLDVFKSFEISQEFMEIAKDTFVLERQEIKYKRRLRNGGSKGNILTIFSNYEINPNLGNKFFNAELSRTEEEAYEKDSSFWRNVRKDTLSVEQDQIISYADSIYDFMNSDYYLDSIDSIYNRVTLIKLLWKGQGYTNRKKEYRVFLPPLVSFWNPVQIGGFRLRTFAGGYKRFEKRKSINGSFHVSYGLRNEDVNGGINFSYLHNPVKRRRLSVIFGRDFRLVNPYDAYLNMFRRSNFYLSNYISLRERMELINGLYFSFGTSIDFRQDLAHFKFGSLADSIFENNTIRKFQSYNALLFNIGLSYTPKQLYKREPYEKVILGSKFPTFSVNYSRGIPNFLGSTVNFDYLGFEINQNINLGVLGESDYRISTGKNFNTSKLDTIDFTFQRQGDPFLFTNPLQTYQLLDQTFPTFNWYLEGHYYHRFNGFLIGRIPFLTRSKIREVAGSSFLIAPETNYKFGEIFAGLDRIFRIGNDHFRLGVYYAIGQSSQAGFRSGLKFSLEYYDVSRNSWSF